VNDAKAMMIDTLRWREEFKTEEAMKETFPDVFNSFGHLYGRDKEGRPMMYAPCSVNIDLLDLTTPTGITSMVEITTLRLLSATYSDSFGAPSELCLYDVTADLPAIYVDGVLH